MTLGFLDQRFLKHLREIDAFLHRFLIQPFGNAERLSNRFRVGSPLV
jgi:hypothetical protein